jgi:hypothetical protein
MTCLKRKLAVDMLSPGKKGGAFFARLMVEYRPAKPIEEDRITNWSQAYPPVLLNKKTGAFYGSG